MKPYFYVIFCSIIFLFACTHESSTTEKSDQEVENSNQLSEEQNQPETEDENIENKQATEIEWSNYHNSRFGFQVRYPSSWEIGDEPTNGDGVTLYNRDGNKITVYASHYMEDFAPNLDQYSSIKTKNGYIAYVQKENRTNNRTDYSMVINKYNLEFHLKAEMSETFYEENKNFLLEIIEAFKIDDREEDSAQNQNIDWELYQNARFGFQVKYPSNWQIGDEPANGDGVSLYKDRKNEILVYASYYFPEFAPDLAQYHEILTKSGERAHVKVTHSDNGEVDYSMVLIKADVQYNISATMTSQFFEENQRFLDNMVKEFEFTVSDGPKG
jgi:hypothetical protein